MKLILLSLIFGVALADPQVFESGNARADIIELYTSEGCSSCPPADDWLNTLTEHPDLFTNVIPLAFHVDYWNWLGWQDAFSQQKFSQRQYQHVKQRNLSQAYTPALIVNNQEWRAWFTGDRSWPASQSTAPSLTLTVNTKDDIEVKFNSSETMTVYVALLGMGITSKIGNGENRGRTLEHNFVVLNLQNQNGASSWRFDRSLLETNVMSTRLALVAWVSEPSKVSIIQASGGFLTD